MGPFVHATEIMVSSCQRKAFSRVHTPDSSLTLAVDTLSPHALPQEKKIENDATPLRANTAGVYTHISPCNACHALLEDLINLVLGKITHEQVLRKVRVGGEPDDASNCT